MKPDEETLRTSWTLVARLKNAGDDQALQEFYDLYRGVIHGVAMKAGLRQDEADDVVSRSLARSASAASSTRWFSLIT